MTEDKVTSVGLSGENLEKLLAYRAACGALVLRIINTAVAEWFPRTGHDRMEILEGKQQQ